MWSIPDWNSSGCSARANHSINDSSEVLQNGTFKRTSLERLNRVSCLAEATPTQRISNDPGVRSTTKAGAVGHASPRTEAKSNGDEHIKRDARAGHPIGMVSRGTPYARDEQQCIAKNCSETHEPATTQN